MHWSDGFSFLLCFGIYPSLHVPQYGGRQDDSDMDRAQAASATHEEVRRETEWYSHMVD